MDNSQVLNKAKCGDSESKLAKLLSLHPSFYFHSLVCVNNAWSGRVLLSTEEQWSQESLVPKPSHYPFWLLTVCKYEGERPGRSHYQIESGYTGGAVPNKESRGPCNWLFKNCGAGNQCKMTRDLDIGTPMLFVIFSMHFKSSTRVQGAKNSTAHAISYTQNITVAKNFSADPPRAPHPTGSLC